MTGETAVHIGERPTQVLVEAPSPISFAVKETLAMPGVQVTYCPGPTAGQPCPVTAGCACWRADHADVIVSALGLGDPEARRIVLGLRQQHPDVPLVVLAWRSDVVAGYTDVEGCEVVVFPWTTHKVQGAIRRVAPRAPMLSDVEAPKAPTVNTVDEPTAPPPRPRQETDRRHPEGAATGVEVAIRCGCCGEVLGTAPTAIVESALIDHRKHCHGGGDEATPMPSTASKRDFRPYSSDAP